MLTGKTLDLRDLAKLSLQNGCRSPSDGTDWRFTKIFADTYGLKFERILKSNLQKVIDAIKAGAGAVVSTHGNNRRIFTTAGHYLAILGFTEDGCFYVADSDFYTGKYTVGQRPDEIKKKRLVVNTKTLEMWVKPDLLLEEMSAFGFDVLSLPKGEDDMTQEQFNEMMDEYLRLQGLKPSSKWPNDEFNKAVEAGITDGTQPQRFATREQVAVMIYRAISKYFLP